MSEIKADVGMIADLIRKANEVISKNLRKTPLDKSSTFSKITKGEVYLKLENLQKTGSFKVRGAMFKISMLEEEQRKKGVIAASAGNHAQGVAFSASMMGVYSKIVMPIHTPLAKVQATRGYGADVVLHGTSFEEANNHALELAEKEKLTYIHPFDDPFVIAGQGTIGTEILQDLPDPDYIFVPVGGGGLVSGVATAIKILHKKDCKIIGVQTKAFPWAYKLKKKIDKLELDEKHTIAEGLAVKEPGKLTSQIIDELVDDVILISERELAYAIYMLLERGKIVAEGAGAASLAGVMSNQIDLKGKKTVSIISGGNINTSLLARIIIGQLLELGGLLKLNLRVLNKTSALRDVLDILARHNISVISIDSSLLGSNASPDETTIEVTIEVGEKKSLNAILDAFRKKGIKVSLS